MFLTIEHWPWRLFEAVPLITWILFNNARVLECLVTLASHGCLAKSTVGSRLKLKDDMSPSFTKPAPRGSFPCVEHLWTRRGE